MIRVAERRTGHSVGQRLEAVDYLDPRAAAALEEDVVDAFAVGPPLQTAHRRVRVGRRLVGRPLRLRLETQINADRFRNRSRSRFIPIGSLWFLLVRLNLECRSKGSDTGSGPIVFG